jgi:hypothetical protein
MESEFTNILSASGGFGVENGATCRDLDTVWRYFQLNCCIVQQLQK